MPNERITLRIESTGPSGHVTLDDFVSQLSALRSALEKTDESLNGGVQTVQWEVVGLSHSSPATIELEAKPRPRNTPANRSPGEVIGAFVSNVRGMGERKAPWRELDYSAVSSYKALAVPVRDARIVSTIIGPSGVVQIRPDLEKTASAVLNQDIEAGGAFKGQLEFLNIHGRKSEVRIYPPAGPNFVTCEFDSYLLDEAKEAVGRNVRVHGKLIYRARAPFPYRIVVSRIEVLPDDSSLPRLSELVGIAPEATGSLSSEAFVRGLRDAE